ncbi:hypothetical protein B0T25DRAFT_502937 [Lasiosphaeria hispida]|uniref:Uncharacterized protein n=1 Tax=Lasiosphaeria hispida TaxID=260671 RepID=A0AAJ0MF42_9PEZI|nr:hypothetical protein B0T25DRAFT_502937 [Lasiosphaeria hispida]
MGSFSPVCTIPPANAGLVSSPNVRSTVDIIWSCLSVILICTWAALHPPVPIEMTKPPSDERNQMGWTQRTRHCFLRKFYNSFIKSYWFAFSVTAPEILTTLEVMGYIAAKHDEKQFKELAEKDGVDWSLAHSLFANMGGFAIKFKDPPQSSTPDQGGHHERSFYENAKALRGNIWVLDGLQLKYAREAGVIKKLPSISNSQFKEKGGGDTVKTILAVFQLLWFTAQLLFRAIRGLSVTLLEISTFAFIVFSITTYLASWSKPQSVSNHVYIDADCLPTTENIRELAKLGPMALWFERGVLWVGGDSAYFREGRSTFKVVIVISATTSAVFSAIHLIAWDFPFPTVQERWAWRIVCLVLSVGSIPGGLLKLVQLHLQKRQFRTTKEGNQIWMGRVVVLFHICAFLIFSTAGMARCFIFVESVRSLWFLPSDAFQATPLWNVPHVG